MSANSTRPMPRLASVRPGPDLTVDVTWSEGARAGWSERIDLAPDIMTYKIYKPLRGNRGLYEQMRLEDDGTRLVWDEIDMAATTVERLAEETMTNDDFRRFLAANNLSFDAASAQLGISRRQVAYYAKDKPVPRTIALACRSLEAARNQ